jgi:ParB/RepB/Spo0J family partition protein
MDPLTLASAPESILEIDIHRLELRYAHTRVISADSLRSLCASLEQFGQISPLVIVAPWVLIDGYRRVAALKRNGKDTALVEVWSCSEKEAIVRLIARPRRWEAIEEAALLREILQDSELSQARLARLIGKDPSWVTRRLDLLDGLSEEMLALIRSGRLSSWAASRVIVPLARANEAHALRLALCIEKEGIGTRELSAWFDHYRRSSRATRERMVEGPSLFLKALHARAEQRQASQLREGARWLADLGSVLRTLRRLQTDTLPDADMKPARQTLKAIKALLDALADRIERTPPHADPGSEADHLEPPPEANAHSHHQQHP